MNDLDPAYVPTQPEITLYRNRITGCIVEAVQYTRDSDRAVYEWAPGKQHHEPGGRINGMTIFTGYDQAGRDRAVHGDWVYQDVDGGAFWVASPDTFADSYELVEQEATR